MKKFPFPALALVLPCLSIRAQSYTIPWYKIAGGGGVSAGGACQLTGTIGQLDAAGAMTGGSYSVTGGFRALINVVPTPGAPSLVISYSGNSVIVSWPNTGNYTFQQNNNPAAADGWVTSGHPISTANGTNSVTITPPTGNLFFRLAHP